MDEKNPAAALQDELEAAPQKTKKARSAAKPKAAAAEDATLPPALPDPQLDLTGAADAPPENPVRVFAVSLKHTNGDGTTRPKFEVHLDMSGEPGRPEQVLPLDPAVPHLGVTIVMGPPADPFQAGVLARERAIRAFDEFYNVRQTEHVHKIEQL